MHNGWGLDEWLLASRAMPLLCLDWEGLALPAALLVCPAAAAWRTGAERAMVEGHLHAATLCAGIAINSGIHDAV